MGMLALVRMLLLLSGADAILFAYEGTPYQKERLVVLHHVLFVTGAGIACGAALFLLKRAVGPERAKRGIVWWFDTAYQRLYLIYLTQLIYLWIGALIFEALEGPTEESHHEQFKLFVRHMNESGLSKEMPDELRRDYANRIAHVDDELWRNWDFFGSLFYCFGLVTTIGYGTIHPITVGGKLFTCVYAVVGIPLNVCLFARLGSAVLPLTLGPCLDRKRARLEATLGDVHSGLKSTLSGTESGELKPDDVARVIKDAMPAIPRRTILRFVAEADTAGDGNSMLHYEEYLLVVQHITEWAFTRVEFAVSLLLLLLLLLICSILLPLLKESWHGVDGLYFCIITWTTIGLGDYIPEPMEGPSSAHEHIEGWFWFFAPGLTLVATVISTFMNAFGSMLRDLATRELGDTSPAGETTGASGTRCVDVHVTRGSQTSASRASRASKFRGTSMRSLQAATIEPGAV